MKKLFSILALLCATIASAQVIHSPGLWLSAGERTLLLPSGSEATNGLGAEAALGGDYTLQAGHFLLNVGAGLSWGQTAVSLPDADYVLHDAVDRDGYVFDFIYQTSARRDQYNVLAVRVPLLLGARFYRFRFLLGGALSYHFFTSAATSLSVATYGDYPQFLDPFTNMPEHQYFNTTSLRARHDFHGVSSLTSSAVVELGYELLPQSAGGPSLWLSAYANVALSTLNFQSSNSQFPALSFPDAFSDPTVTGSNDDMLSLLRINPALSSSAVAEGRMLPFSVGIKLSLVFPHVASSSRSHGPCRCLLE